MKKRAFACGIAGIIGILLCYCSDKAANGTPFDTTVIGKWEGAIPPIPLTGFSFDGVNIFVDFSKTDSTFSLITRSYDTTQTGSLAIKDTTFVLNGTWDLNVAEDTIYLKSATCRGIDTNDNTLTARSVEGQVIPVLVSIAKDKSAVRWDVRLADLLPVAPLFGLDVSGISASDLQRIGIVLEKKSQ